jgi:hypothetical protein
MRLKDNTERTMTTVSIVNQIAIIWRVHNQIVRTSITTIRTKANKFRENIYK